jgi:hypothetical protein
MLGGEAAAQRLINDGSRVLSPISSRYFLCQIPDRPNMIVNEEERPTVRNVKDFGESDQWEKRKVEVLENRCAILGRGAQEVIGNSFVNCWVFANPGIVQGGFDNFTKYCGIFRDCS